MSLALIVWRRLRTPRRCLARTDYGLRCQLRPHTARRAHKHNQGETVTMWQVITWTDRTFNHEREEG